VRLRATLTTGRRPAFFHGRGQAEHAFQTVSYVLPTWAGSLLRQQYLASSVAGLGFSAEQEPMQGFVARPHDPKLDSVELGCLLGSSLRE
jgi:hypothetical protein